MITEVNIRGKASIASTNKAGGPGGWGALKLPIGILGGRGP